jgi:GxxExxY protein
MFDRATVSLRGLCDLLFVQPPMKPNRSNRSPLFEHSLISTLIDRKGIAMHSAFSRANSLSREVIGAAIEVHRIMGPGLLESIYQKCLIRELTLREIPNVNQQLVPITYKGLTFTEELRVDIFVDQCLLVELKAVETVHPIFKAQLLSYMKLLNVPIGLLLNFHEPRLIDGVSRLINSGTDT